MQNLIIILFLFVHFQDYAIAVNTSADITIDADGQDSGDPLYLTNLIKNGQIDEARQKALVQRKDMHFVESYAGYFTVNKQYNSNVFMWYFQSMSNPKSDPLLLWLHGGPGSTVLSGIFNEHGPFIVTQNETLERRKYAWCNNHNIIYIDYPVGTGYSFTEDDAGYVTNQAEITRDLLEFVQQFFMLFPELRENEFYVAAESYGGKFAVYLSTAIKSYNDKVKDKINLQGITMGSTLIAPEYQSMNADFLYSVGLVDFDGWNQIKKLENKVVMLKKLQEYVVPNSTVSLIIDSVVKKGMDMKDTLAINLSGFNRLINILEIRESERNTWFTEWVQRPNFRRAVHVGNNTFVRRSSVVKKFLSINMAQSVASIFADLLQHYRILFYSGQLDGAVPYTSNINFLRSLKWVGADDYKKAERKQWWIHDELAGYWKTAGNLEEVLVRNAGHIIASDQPKSAWELITLFTRKNSPKLL